MALEFMDDPSLLSRELTWWSNGERGHWHATRDCDKAQPDRLVRQRSSIVDAQGRLCRSCFPRALTTLGIARQWSAAQQASRIASALAAVVEALGESAGVSSGRAIVLRRGLDSVDGQLASYRELSSFQVEAYNRLISTGLQARSEVTSLVEPAAEQALRWGACCLVADTHDWAGDSLSGVLGRGSSGSSALREVFDAFASSLVLHPSVARATERARLVVSSAKLSSLSQLRGVPATRSRSGDMLAAAESAWREFIWDASSDRLRHWSVSYRRLVRRQGLHLVGLLSLPPVGRAPDMVHAAVEAFRVSAPVSRGVVVLQCPAVVASALEVESRGWHWDSVVDAGPCGDREVAETAAALWSPLGSGPLAYLADALSAAEKLT